MSFLNPSKAVEDMTEALESSFDALEGKGTDIPVEHTFKTLLETISEVPENRYGVLEYYEISRVFYFISITRNCTADVIDETLADNIMKNAIEDGIGDVYFYYYPSEEKWKYTDKDGNSVEIAPENMITQVGVRVTLSEGAGSPYFMITGFKRLGNTKKYILKDLTEYTALGTTNVKISFSTFSVRKDVIKSFTFGEMCSFVPNNFFEISSIETISELPDSCLTIGDCFLCRCENFECNSLNLKNVTTIGDYFLSGCTKLEYTNLNLKNVTTIGDCFLSGCDHFNANISMEKVQNTGSFFLNGCSRFNQNLNLTNVENIGTYFMYSCIRFDSQLNIPKVKTIEEAFMRTCEKFNQTIEFPNSLKTIGTYFMHGCTKFNQDIHLPNTLTSVGTHFLYYVPEMMSTVYTGTLAATIFASSDYTFAAASTIDAQYKQGIKLCGVNAQAIKSRFPDSGRSPYRKLIVEE